MSWEDPIEYYKKSNLSRFYVLLLKSGCVMHLT